jgi:hypothetical protein
MRKLAWLVCIVLLFGFAAGCRKAEPVSADDQAIRAALQKYLAERGTLNISAMDMDMKQVNVTGNTATARVEFRAKGSGAGMEMTYNFERKGDTWAVKSSQNTGGLTHPPIDQSATPASPGELPSGHPPVTAPDKAATPPKKN